MAMTKAEAARMAELEAALALCWPPYSKPSPMTVEEIRSGLEIITHGVAGYSKGRKATAGFFCNAYNGEITEGFSDGHYHSRSGGTSWSQTSGCMYRSKKDAAMALRHEMSANFAKKLAAIDRIIREAE